jgi:ubiquinone/menaquinone biosynthesis C-methylase UbiE
MDDIIRHYGGTSSLLESIIEAIGDSGIELEDLTVDDLGPVDEFHIGGRAATQRLVDRAKIPNGSRVLDVGSGVGGTGRFLAETGAHKVTGVDITPEYVEVANALSTLVGAEESAEFRLGDVCELPFSSGSFDAAVLLHVGMNIEDKRTAFSEVARVLVGGGVFAIYDIMGPDDVELEFPVPWASSGRSSYLATANEYTRILEDVGFEVEDVADRSEFAKEFFAGLRERSEATPAPRLGLHLLMGEEAQIRYGNMVKAVDAGLIGPVEILASKPRSGS